MKSTTAKDLLFAVLLFFAFYLGLAAYVAPLFTARTLGPELDEAAKRRFPVLAVVEDGGAKKVQVLRLAEVEEGKAKVASLLPPSPAGELLDQHGAPASYTASPSAPGKQRVKLKASLGDYIYDVEYEAGETKVVPLRTQHTGPYQSFFILPPSLLLTWMLMRFLARRAIAKMGERKAGRSRNEIHEER